METITKNKNILRLKTKGKILVLGLTILSLFVFFASSVFALPTPGGACLMTYNNCLDTATEATIDQCYTDYAICTSAIPSDSCANGADNPPTCNMYQNSCLNSATNPPTCTIIPPPTAPSSLFVTTGSATNITQTSATLSGTA